MKYLISLLLCFVGFSALSQGYHPTKHIAVNDAIAPAQKTPIDARQQYYDTALFSYRDFASSAEILSTYTTGSVSRYGHPLYFVNSGGALSMGIWIGGTTQIWSFLNGVADSQLVQINTAFSSIPQNVVDTVYRVNDSTVGYKQLNGNVGSFIIRGTAAGGISSLLLNVPTSLFVTPVTFTNSGGAWGGTLSTVNQSAGTVFAAPATGGLGQPGFRSLVVSDLPTGIPNGNLANSSILLSQDNTGIAPGWATSSVSLGGTALYHNPSASATTSGYLLASDWIRFNSAVTASVISVNGQTGVVVAKNADSLMSYPIDFTNFHAGWTLSVSPDSSKLLFNAPGSGSGITHLNGLIATSQFFAIGTSGTSPNWSSVTATHTLNIPTVNGADTGLMTPAMYNQLNLALASISTTNSVTGLGTVASPVQLIGDAASPGNSFYYGTNSSGAKGFYVIPSGVASANPTTNIGLSTINGSATTFMRSDAAPALSQSIVPTWTGAHTFNGGVTIGSQVSFGADNTYSLGTTTVGANSYYGRFFESDAILTLAAINANPIDFFNNGVNTMQLLNSGQLVLNKYVTSTSFTGTPTSILAVDASGNVIQTSVTFPIGAVQGLHVEGTTGDSVAFGGFFYKPDTLSTLGFPLLITGLPDKATLLGTDSVLIETIAGQVYKVPSSAIGGGGGAVSSVSDNGGGTLTISPTTGAVLAGINLANANTWTGNITANGVSYLFGTNGASTVGNSTNNALSINTHQIRSNASQAYVVAAGNNYTYSVNASQVAAIASTGQLQLNNYTTTSSFTGTPVGVLEFDASGNVLTAALGSSTITLTGTSGGAQVASAFTFATTTNTANTALTIPGGSNIFTFTYNPAWDMWDNSRTANNNLFGGASVGNTTLTGVRNIGIGGSGATGLTSGSNNILIGVNTGFVITTASDDIFMGYLAGTADISGGENVGIGGQSLRNNTATQITAVGYLAGEGNTSGTSNAFFGFQAGFANSTGLGNTYLGNQAGKNATTPSHNTFAGWLAGTTDITGGDNSGFGFGAASGLTDGGFNTSLGSLALDFGIHNLYTVEIGYKSAALDTASIGFVTIGNYAASATLGLNYSVIIGDSALGSSFPVGIGSATRSSTKAIIIGAYNGFVNTPSDMAHYDSSVFASYKTRMAESSTDTAGYNIVWVGGFNDTTNRHDFIQLGNEINQILNFSYTGNGSGGGLTTARYSSIGGRLGDIFWNKDSSALNYYDGTALHNFGTGSGGGGLTTVAWSTTSNANAGSISGVTLTLTAADGTNPGGISEIAQTMGSGVKTFTSDAVIHGVRVGTGVGNNTGETGVGNGVLNTAHTSTGNTMMGLNAGFNINGSGVGANTAMGMSAGVNLTSGHDNTFAGYQSGDNKYTANFNTAFGSGAEFGNSSLGLAAVDNTAIGYHALNVDQGSDNTALGYLALQSNTTGGHNLAFSVGALGSNTTGNYNTATGAQSGNSLTTGSYELFIGPWVDAASPTETDTMRILNGLIGTGLSSPTALYNTPVTTFRLGIATYPNAAFTLTAGGAVQIGNFSNTYTWNPNNAIPGSFVSIQPGTLNDATTAASGTVANAYVTGITSPTLSATNTGVVVTNAYSFWINNQPVAGTNVTITNAYALGVTGNSLFNGTITSGAVNITGKADLTGQTGAVTVTTYAVPGSTTFNTFEVGGYITVTAVSLDVIQLQVTWTDETSTSRTQSFFVQGATTGISATGANAYSPMDIRVKKGTTITVATVLTTGTGSITYDVGGFITQIY